MKPAIYTGTIAHRRSIPRVHAFAYPFFMWFFNLDELDKLPSLGPWFSHRKWALSRFVRADYLGDSKVGLGDAVRETMEEITGHPVTGEVCGLMNLRYLGLYFSPVNFYYGFDGKGALSHFLAEVSNIPWNERHHYAYFILDGKCEPVHPKSFHVSPFNPMEQQYRWQIGYPGDDLRVQLEVHDQRGQIFQAILELKRQHFTRQAARKQLLKKPVMTASIVGGIYWQALKLYAKGVPYVPYQRETL